jgi:integrase
MPIYNTLIPSSVKKGDRNGRIQKNGATQKDHGVHGKRDARQIETIGECAPYSDGRAGSNDTGELYRAPTAGAQAGEKGGAFMRGDGHIFQKGRIWWIAYSFRGHPYQESSQSAERKDAEKLLKRRLREMHKPNFVDPAKEQRCTLDDMKKTLKLDYERKGNRSSIEWAFKHLEAGFKFHRLIDLSTERIEEYADMRIKDGAKPASVNRELAALRRGFKLMVGKKMLSSAPVINLYQENNVRQGFIEIGDFNALLEKVPNNNARDVIEFLYHSGWRSGEAKALKWGWIDGNMIRLPGEFSKNKKPRPLPITGALIGVLERRTKLRRMDCPFVFHRNGKPVKSFSRAFKAAAKEIGQPGLLPHDMRRSAVRNFRKSGLSEGDGMMLSGHKTRAVYDRYDIRDDQDAIEAMNRVQEHLKKEAEKRKVMPLKRETA